ncbi:MAG TPA: helix-turn-helix transcriptional regulator [bacterium]|nr:helix-turn-helix transcriptional regulator [bacterium]
MKQYLNINSVNKALREKGWSKSNLSEVLGLSRTIISDWFNSKKFPRPKHLLQLSDLLGISYENLVTEDLSNEPVVAFRKMGNCKTQPEHVQNAKDRGWLLKPLVKYLPEDSFKLILKPRELINISLDYDNIETTAAYIRNHCIKDVSSGPIPFSSLIRAFSDFNAVIIPALLGDKEKHENAVHIYLPDSKTNWIFLNLDVNVLDFKFWMAHEFTHLLMPELSIQELEKSEDFADAVAGAILFSKEKATSAWNRIGILSNNGLKINMIKEIAKENVISPYTVYKQVNLYLKEKGIAPLKFNIGGANKNFTRQYPTVSQLLFKDNNSAELYLKVTKEEFHSPFFDLVKKFMKEKNKNFSYLGSLLNTSPTDSKAICEALLSEEKNSTC